MENWDAATIAARGSSELKARYLVYIRGKQLDGDPQPFGYWTGEDDIELNVVSGLDGSIEARSFVGGVITELDPIVSSIGIDARTTSVYLARSVPVAVDMVRGFNIRHAPIEIHRADFDPSTGELVANPLCIFLGKIDGAPIERPAIGGGGTIDIRCVSNSVELTRTNPAKKSDQTQLLRDGDRFRRYSDTATLMVWWGEERAR